jgi:hypothetical protein
LVFRRVGFQHEAFRIPKLEFQGLESQPVSLSGLDESKNAYKESDWLYHAERNPFTGNF